MKKTSVYLSAEDRERLARLAKRKGESQAWVLREALLAYDAREPDRDFQIFKIEPIDGVPVFDDPQDFHDWVVKTAGDAMVEDIQRQLDEARTASS
jgi:hypothetical protein